MLAHWERFEWGFAACCLFAALVYLLVMEIRRR